MKTVKDIPAPDTTIQKRKHYISSPSTCPVSAGSPMENVDPSGSFVEFKMGQQVF